MVDAATIAVLIWLKLYSTTSTRPLMFLRVGETYQRPFKPFLRVGKP
jgi:hypothetical protein